MIPDFIEVNAIEFDALEAEVTPISIRVSEILSFQPMSKRARRHMMAQQTKQAEQLRQTGQEFGITEPPVDCCGVMLKRTVHSGQPFFVINLWVEESYTEIKHKLEAQQRTLPVAQ